MKRAFPVSMLSMLLLGGLGVVVACGGDDESPPAPSDAGTDATLDQSVVDTGIDTGIDAGVADAREGGTTLDGGACGGDPVVITSVVPQFAWKDGRTALTITGTGFIATPKVYLRDATGKLTQLSHVAFVSSTSITAVIPAGAFTAGTYEVAVINGNSCADTIPGLRIVDQAPPVVLDVDPAAGTTQNDVQVTIKGCSFDANATVSTVSSTGAVTVMTNQAPSCTGPNVPECNDTPLCTMTATIQTKTKALPVGAYLIRVTNPTPNTYGEYSTFVVTNPAGNLGMWETASSLTTGRRSLGLVAGRVDDANRYLYAIGGEDAAGTALDTVEIGPLDRFGQLGKWSVATNKLTTKRSGAAAVRHGQWIYVLGGTSGTNGTKGAAPTGAVLASVERARILDPSGAPKLNDPTAATGGALAKGTWYYQVSAVGGDADNPGGESVASEEAVVTVDANGKVTLTWSAVAGATAYRIYRSTTPDATSGSEVLVAVVDGGTTTYVDSGGAGDGGNASERPLGIGALGVWQSLGDVIGGRSNASAVVAVDPAGDAYLYLIGGWGKCLGGGANAVTGCVEYAKIGTDGTLGTFATTNALQTARMRHEAAVLSRENGPSAFTDAGTADNAAFIVVGGGRGAAASGDLGANIVEYALVTTGGGLTFTAAAGFSNERDGLQVEIANGFMFAFQGGDPQVNGAVQYTATADSSIVQIGNNTLTFPTWNNAGGNLGGANKLGRHGITAESAYFYMVGGTTNDTDALTTVRRILH